MNEHFGLGIRGKMENLTLVSNFVGNSMGKYGLNDYEQAQIQMAVNEAVTNIIKHANPEDKIQIKCQKQGNEIKIIIESKGKPFNPVNVEMFGINSSIRKNTDVLKVYFIKKNMNKSEYEFKDGKNILTLIKHL